MQLVRIVSFILLAVSAVEAGPGGQPSGDINPTATVGPGGKRWISGLIKKREEVQQAK